MIDKIVELSKELLSIPSTEDKPEALKKALNLLKNEVKDYTVEEFEHNGSHSILAYKGSGRPDKFRVILNGHIDVVPGEESQYKPIEENGKLHARGAYDMKAAATVMTMVFRDVANQLKYPLALQIVTDEEVGGRNGTKYQIEQGIRGDFVIAGEASNLQLSYKSKGLMTVKVSFHGSTAHAAYPWNGKSAIWRMKHFLDKLEEKFPIPKTETWKTTVNVAQVHTSNTTINKVPADCTLMLDVRYISEDQDTIEDDLKSCLSDGGHLEVVSRDSAHFTNQENPFVVALQNAAERVTGIVPPFIAKHGASDLRHYDKVDCPAVLFGPVGAGLHSDEEWVEIKSLEDYYFILKDFLLGLN